MIDRARSVNESLGVGMYTSLMGTFDFPAPINYIGSSSVGRIDFTFEDFCSISNYSDPWILPMEAKP